jgi:hypothetical protein
VCWQDFFYPAGLACPDFPEYPDYPENPVSPGYSGFSGLSGCLSIFYIFNPQFSVFAKKIVFLQKSFNATSEESHHLVEQDTLLPGIWDTVAHRLPFCQVCHQ